MTERNPYHPDGLWPTAGSYTRTDEWRDPRDEEIERLRGWIDRAERFEARAEKAERERDEARAYLTERCTACGEDPSGPLRPLTTDELSYRYAQDLGYELPEDPR